MKTTFIAKSLLVMSISFLASMQSMAQNPSREDMEEHRAEMTEKRAEKLAKDFDLKDDAKEKFVSSFKAYQDELMGIQREVRKGDKKGEKKNDGKKGDGEKKKLTDEEATKRVAEYFSQQEEQIAQMQKRLDVDKKYYDEWKKTLTPQQLARIFRKHQRMGGQQGGGQHRQGGFGGPQGGGRPGGMGGHGGFGGGMGGDF